MSAATKTEDSQLSEEGQPWRILQRVILPSQSQMDTVPLYIDTGTATGMQLPTSNLEATAGPRPRPSAAPSKEAHVEDFLTRHSTSVRPGERVSFGTYFNAFAASYWRRWTTVNSVRLSVSDQWYRLRHRLQVQRPRCAAAR